MVVLGNVAAMSAADQSPNAIKVDEQDHYHEEWVLPFDFRDGVRIKTNQKFADYYELYEEIGEGKFGKVFRCVEKSTKLTLAAKCIRLKRDADLQKVEKEVNIMTHMRHKCIAQIYDAFATSTNEIILIMEIVNGGELFDRVVDDTYILTEKAVGMIVYQICEAISYIHSQKIIHLDLKPENIMCISQTGNQIKLIDFGLAQYFDGQSDLLFMAGTPEFAAPEVIKFEPLDFHTDMWSLGVITYILLSGVSPFLGENIAVTYCNVERGKWEFCEEFKENCISDEAKDFISNLLVLEKDKRMLPKNCLEHPWMVKCKERAKSGVLNSAITEGKQLDVNKLRVYVRNKRFRRLVFGVLFINTVVRMVSTLQEKKSEHGIQYVKNMLSAANDSSKASESQSGLLKAMFSKRRRNVTSSTERPSTSHQTSSGEELHTKPKRLNKEPRTGSKSTLKESTNSSTPATLSLPQSSGETSGGEEASINSPTSSLLSSTHHKEEKAKRVKSTTRKGSSTEQAAKKLKTGGLPVPEVKVVLAEEPISIVKKLVKLGEMKKDEGNAFQLPVAGAVPVVKKAVSEGTVSFKKTSIKTHEETNHEVLTTKMFASTIHTPVVPVLKARHMPETHKKIDKPTEIHSETKSMLSTSSFKPTEEIIKVLRPKTPDLKPAEDNKAVLRPKTVDPKPAEEKKPASKPKIPEQNPTEEKKAVLRPKTPELKLVETNSRPKAPESKPSSLVGSLLKRLEKSEGTAMPLAVSGFLPSSTKEILKKKFGSAEDLATESKIKARSGDDKSKKKARTRKTTTVLLQLNVDEVKNGQCTPIPISLEKKVITEEKTSVKKSSAKKEMSSGGSNEQQKMSSNTSSTQVRVSSCTTTEEKEGKVQESATGSYSKSVAEKEKQISKVKSTKQTENIVKEQESREMFEVKLRKTENGVRLLQGQMALDDVEKNKLVLSTKVYGDKMESALVTEKKKTLKAKVNLNGEQEVDSSEASKKLILTIPNGVLKYEQKEKTTNSDKKKVAKETVHRSLGNLASSDLVDLKKKDVTFSHNILPTNSSIETAKKKVKPKADALFSERKPKSENSLTSEPKNSVCREKPRVKFAQSLQSEDSIETNEDAFDFRLLRKKLQQRISGCKDDKDLATEIENKQKCEQRVQLADTGNTKRAMSKWMLMDKEAKTNPLSWRSEEW